MTRSNGPSAAVLETHDAEIGIRQAFGASASMAALASMPIQRAPGAAPARGARLAGAGAELEHGFRVEPSRRGGDGVLELLVAGDLVEHLGEVRSGFRSKSLMRRP